MKKDIADRWVAELRSGKYPQAKNQLRMNDADGNAVGYCCLGVLSEMARQEGACEYRVSNYGAPVYDNNLHYMPGSVIEWAGMDNGTGTLSTEESMDTPDGRSFLNLSRINDEGFSFDVIADLIEEHWEKL